MKTVTFARRFVNYSWSMSVKIVEWIKNLFIKSGTETIPEETRQAAGEAAAEVPVEAALDALLPEYVLSQSIIDAELTDLQFFQIGDVPNTAHPRFIWKYVGEVLYAGGGVLTLCAGLKDEETFAWGVGAEVALAFLRSEEMYLSSARIEDLRESQKFEANVPALFRDNETYKDNLKRVFSSSLQTRFVFLNALVLTDPKKHKRRQHIRIVIAWTVYFRLADPDDEQASLQEDWLARQVFRVSDGMFVVYTVDVSEGGFSSLVKEQVPTGAYLDVVFEFDNEQSTARGGITARVVDCSPHPAREGFFQLRVTFTEISDPVRAVLVRNILAHSPTPVNAEAQVTVAEDGSEASIRITPPRHDGADLSYLALKRLLAQNEVVFGIDEHVLVSLNDNPKYDRDIVVAHGIRPKNGENAVLTYHVDLISHLKPVEREDGTVDFKSLGLIQEVEKGAILCEKTQWTSGIPGTDVRGKRLPAEPGSDVVLPSGQNTILSDDGLRLQAQMGGHITVIQNQIHIMNTFVVRGGVTTETGNIDFLGNVIVFGDVLEGFSIRASGDVTVNGVVESARIQAGGSLVIRGGFIGITGELEVGEDCTCKFINGGRIMAKGMVKTMYAVNSFIQCGALETVGVGILRNCHIVSKTSVKANYTGNETFHDIANTVIEVGNDPVIMAQIRQLSDEEADLDNMNEELSTQIAFLFGLRDTGKLTPKRLSQLGEAQKKLVAAQIRLLELSAMKADLDSQMVEAGFGTLTVVKKAYPGLRIVVGTDETILDGTYASVVFSRKDHDIIAEPYKA